MRKLNPIVYVTMYCPDTGMMALVPVPNGHRGNTMNGVFFSNHRHPRHKSIFTAGVKGYSLMIDEPAHKQVTDEAVLKINSTKMMFLAAFSTPERALACLTLWIATKGEQDLPAE
ncbi:MAG: hypothetical protein NTX72_01130 [Candidatus Uhrbacteria bacterium]|nr:hypothetical protein [Candidatus Uhrbacteria bacterium]